MDNLTHGLIGYALYKLSVPSEPEDKPVERKLLWASILASEVPDIDMISAFWGSAANLDWHRTYTHAVPGLILAAAVITFLFLKLYPALPRGRLIVLTLAGGALHSFFDVLTSYGTRALLPWDGTPYAWDILPIIDPVLIVLLVIFVAVGRYGGRKTVLVSLVILMAGYIGWRGNIHQNAVETVKAGFPNAVKVGVTPSLRGPFTWYYIAMLHDGAQVGSIKPDGITPTEYYTEAGPNEWVAAAENSEAAKKFLAFARFPVRQVVKEGELTHVAIFDARWGPSKNALFASHIWLDGGQRIIRGEIW